MLAKLHIQKPHSAKKHVNWTDMVQPTAHDQPETDGTEVKPDVTSPELDVKIQQDGNKPDLVCFKITDSATDLTASDLHRPEMYTPMSSIFLSDDEDSDGENERSNKKETENEKVSSDKISSKTKFSLKFTRKIEKPKEIQYPGIQYPGFTMPSFVSRKTLTGGSQDQGPGHLRNQRSIEVTTNEREGQWVQCQEEDEGICLAATPSSTPSLTPFEVLAPSKPTTPALTSTVAGAMANPRVKLSSRETATVSLLSRDSSGFLTSGFVSRDLSSRDIWSRDTGLGTSAMNTPLPGSFPEDFTETFENKDGKSSKVKSATQRKSRTYSRPASNSKSAYLSPKVAEFSNGNLVGESPNGSIPIAESGRPMSGRKAVQSSLGFYLKTKAALPKRPHTTHAIRRTPKATSTGKSSSAKISINNTISGKIASFGKIPLSTKPIARWQSSQVSLRSSGGKNQWATRVFKSLECDAKVEEGKTSNTLAVDSELKNIQSTSVAEINCKNDASALNDSYGNLASDLKAKFSPDSELFRIRPIFSREAGFCRSFTNTPESRKSSTNRRRGKSGVKKHGNSQNQTVPDDYISIDQNGDLDLDSCRSLSPTDDGNDRTADRNTRCVGGNIRGGGELTRSACELTRSACELQVPGDDGDIRAGSDQPRPSTTSGLEERKRKREERVRPWASMDHIDMDKLQVSKHNNRRPLGSAKSKFSSLSNGTNKTNATNDTGYSTLTTGHNCSPKPVRRGRPLRAETERWMLQNEVTAWCYEADLMAAANDEQEPITSTRQKLLAMHMERIIRKHKSDGDGMPHQDFFILYHHKSLGKFMAKSAAIIIQRYWRGLTTRLKMRRLKDRVLLRHCPRWERFVTEYRSLLVRIQKRGGVNQGGGVQPQKRPKMPFSFKEVNQYLDRKEMFESVFDDTATDQGLEHDKLYLFFMKAGLDVTPQQVDDTFKALFKGCGQKGEIVFVVDCSGSVGPNNFRLIQQFIKSMIDPLHIGGDLIRVGYVAYHTAVYDSFALDKYTDKKELIKTIMNAIYRRGGTRTDLGIEKMRDYFKKSRKGVPKTAVLITDGDPQEMYKCQEQSKAAYQSGINLFIVIIGKNIDLKEFFLMVTGRDQLLRIPSYDQLHTMKPVIYEMAAFNKCTFCKIMTPMEYAHEEMANRPLHKQEVLEMCWMLSPPLAIINLERKNKPPKHSARKKSSKTR